MDEGLFGLRCVWHGRARLGEGPLWSTQLQRLLFVDIVGMRIIAWSPREAPLEWSLPEACCWLVERRDADGFIAGMKRRIVHMRIDPRNGPRIISSLYEPEPHLPGNRLNDGKADGTGRIWFGTMDDGEERNSGSFYRMDAHSLACLDGGYCVANGPAFSPDGATVYHTDSMARTVYAFALTPDGTISGKHTHIRIDSSEGYPDGMTVDAQGGLWVAHWQGGRVSHFLPDGTRDLVVPIPTGRVTSLAFYGERFEHLAVTTAALNDASDEFAGALFTFDPPIGGAAPATFDTGAG